MASPGQAHHQSPADGSRRSFLGVLLGVASASMAAMLGVPVLRFVFYPLTAMTDESDWAEVGPTAMFSAIGAPVPRKLNLEQRDGWRETTSHPLVYVVNVGGKVKVLSAICPHLGCTVPWNPGRNEFVCPCHGGTFSADGTHLSGPPRRSLDSLDTRVSGGKLMVKYQYFRPDVTIKEVIS
ncbi:MAG: Rieske 2Fe-2S domain-containing protein [Candidatus Krumholzibacteriia bacterium]